VLLAGTEIDFQLFFYSPGPGKKKSLLSLPRIKARRGEGFRQKRGFLKECSSCLS